MRMPKWLFLILLLAIVSVTAGGCARAARNSESFTVTDTATVNLPKDQAWQLTKEVLREHDFDLYTRDKRGVFVAFSKMKRNLFLVPSRTKYTVTLETADNSTTQVTVETVNQVFGVTLLTYPGWFDRKTTDHSRAQEIIQALQGKAVNTAATS